MADQHVGGTIFGRTAADQASRLSFGDLAYPIATSEAPSDRVAEKRLGRALRAPGIICRELLSGRSAGAMVGGVGGASLARRLGRALVRRLVIAIGLAMSLALLTRL